MVKYAPSVMCADFLHLEKDIRDMDRAGADFYHIDIMDGHFVPNLSLNIELVGQLKTVTGTPMDVHLMVDNPDIFLSLLDKIKAEYVSFHIEAVRYPIRMLRLMKVKA